MLDLESAIKHEEKLMMENLEKTKDRNASDPIAINCFECADEHRQLAEWLKDYKRLLEQEPCEDVCEWFVQSIDIVTDIVEFRFSDGTVKRAKRGLYMRDIEESLRKMLIDQMANEKKQEPKWISVSEKLPEEDGEYLATIYDMDENYEYIDIAELEDGKWCYKPYILVKAWMPLPEPYKAESEG